MSIDTRAVVDPSAKIAEGVTIGPFSIIGADVEIAQSELKDAQLLVRNCFTVFMSQSVTLIGVRSSTFLRRILQLH